MIKVRFIDNDQKVTEIEAKVGLSILEIAHQNDVDLEGVCEGSLACSTCHVILDKKSYDLLPKASEEEEDAMDFACNVSETSRLSCQIMITEELAKDKDGLVIECKIEN